jgi:inosine/xanthosine triphosphate pyrophosphatase family protein
MSNNPHKIAALQEKARKLSPKDLAQFRKILELKAKEGAEDYRSHFTEQALANAQRAASATSKPSELQ